MAKYFGTDGIRGDANDKLTAELALNVGKAAATVLRKDTNCKVKVVIGKDTRISSDMIESALIAGLNSCGADVVTLGVAPTPAVAYITTQINADAGIVISASHNSFESNGIKIFNSQGFKLSDELEAEIERLVDDQTAITPAEPSHIGRIIPGGVDHLIEYIQHLRSCGNITKRLNIAVDCSNGASEVTAEKLFGPYASELHILHDQPNGLNINDKCGSTAPERLQAIVTALGCDVGFAFDGDADRCIAVDETGELVNGDKLMAIIGLWMKEHKLLEHNTIVATVMSNLGLTEFTREQNIKLLKAAVGDRNVLELMQREGAVFGGEQSGHVIFLNDATTGDGQLCAIKLLSVLTDYDTPLSTLAAKVKTYPQVLVGVKVHDKIAAMDAPELQAAIAAAEAELGENGTILVRPSGTEPLIRVNVEATTEEIAAHIATAVAAAVAVVVGLLGRVGSPRIKRSPDCGFKNFLYVVLSRRIALKICLCSDLLPHGLAARGGNGLTTLRP